nr:hypothetical protein [uncultured Halomonas sp.]
MQTMRSHQAYGGTLLYHHAETVTAATGDAVLLPGVVRAATVAVHPGAGATVEYTVSHPDAVAAGTANWVAWSGGQVTAPTVAQLPERVTAARLIAATNASTWEVVV